MLYNFLRNILLIISFVVCQMCSSPALAIHEDTPPTSHQEQGPVEGDTSQCQSLISAQDQQDQPRQEQEHEQAPHFLDFFYRRFENIENGLGKLQVSKLQFASLLELPGWVQSFRGLMRTPQYLALRSGRHFQAANYLPSGAKEDSNPDEDEDDLEDSETGKKPNLENIIAVLNQPDVYYFKIADYQTLNFTDGSADSFDHLRASQIGLDRGVPVAQIKIKNPVPRLAYPLMIPEGYRPIIQPASSLTKVWKDKSGAYFFRSSAQKWASIYLANIRPQRLSAEELDIYTRVDNPVQLTEWPKEFAEHLQKIIAYVKQHKHELDPLQVAKILESSIETYMIYTRKGDARLKNAIDIVSQQKCQCSWAAVLPVGLLRYHFKIPSRVVIGLAGRRHFDHPGQTFVIDNRVGHAWFEVYDNKRAMWVRFDATPKLSEEMLQNPAIKAQRESHWARLSSAGGQQGAGAENGNGFGFVRVSPKDNGIALPESFASILNELESTAKRALSQLANPIKSLGSLMADQFFKALMNENFKGFGQFNPDQSEGKNKSEKNFWDEFSKDATPIQKINQGYVLAYFAESLKNYQDFPLLRENLTRLKGEMLHLREVEEGEVLISDKFYEWVLLRINKILSYMIIFNVRARTYAELNALLEDKNTSSFQRIGVLSLENIILKEVIKWGVHSKVHLQRQFIVRTALNKVTRIVNSTSPAVSSSSSTSVLMTASEKIGRVIESLLPGDYSKNIWKEFVQNNKISDNTDWMSLVTNHPELNLIASTIFHQNVTFPLNYRELLPASVIEEKRFVQVPASDHELDIDQASEIYQFRHFIRGAISPEYDLQRLQLGHMPARIFQDPDGMSVWDRRPPVRVTALLPPVSSPIGKWLLLLEKMIVPRLQAGEWVYYIDGSNWLAVNTVDDLFEKAFQYRYDQFKLKTKEQGQDYWRAIPFFVNEEDALTSLRDMTDDLEPTVYSFISISDGSREPFSAGNIEHYLIRGDRDKFFERVRVKNYFDFKSSLPQASGSAGYPLYNKIENQDKKANGATSEYIHHEYLYNQDVYIRSYEFDQIDTAEYTFWLNELFHASAYLDYQLSSEDLGEMPETPEADPMILWVRNQNRKIQILFTMRSDPEWSSFIDNFYHLSEYSDLQSPTSDGDDLTAAFKKFYYRSSTSKFLTNEDYERDSYKRRIVKFIATKGFGVPVSRLPYLLGVGLTKDLLSQLRLEDINSLKGRK